MDRISHPLTSPLTACVRAAPLAVAVLLTGCYLSYEPVDEFVPPSACIDDASTLALTPANRTPGGCLELTIDASPDTRCSFDPVTPFSSYPETWRRMRIVNATDQPAAIAFGFSTDACPSDTLICWAYFNIPVDHSCTCERAGGGSGDGASPAGLFEFTDLPPHSEREYIVAGPNGRAQMRICDEI